MYKLFYKSAVEKDLKHLPKGEIKKIVNGIEKRFAANPHHGKPLKGDFRGCYRYRFGDYRVIYSIIDEEILILRIGNRKGHYK
ncbi:MAG: type II toxin-antitoxin system RelE/ParE family toxin [Chitinispirillaceae bacterium]|nr:type II toxin-antitoxin system RelE/ParE family toxin [Chitinispirillaceae bacterium]